ncbi:hypothetical protein Tco_0916544 [Tanacetum coccineum]
MEVEPLNETKLEEVGLNCNHNTPLSSWKHHSFYKPKPQPKPSPNCPPLDTSLGTERGFKPPIKPQSPDGFRMKVLDNLTIHTPPSSLVASFHLRDLYCYYRPCVNDPKKHYGFKPGLLGNSGSLGVAFSKLGMIGDHWKLESEEVSLLGRGLNSPVRPKYAEKVMINEIHHLEHVIQQLIFQHLTPSHNNSIYTQIDIDHVASGNLRVLSAEEAWETIEDYAQCDKQWKNITNTIPDKTIANLKTQLVKNEVVRVKIPRCMAWLDDEPIRDLNMMEDKVDNPSPQSTLQVLLSFEEYTPHATYPEEVENTIGIPMEVEPLNETKLEEVGLNCNHNTPLSSRKDHNDPKKHYGFKSGLLGHSGSLGVDFSKLRMIGDHWKLESEEVSLVGKGLNSPVRPKYAEKVIFDEKKLGSS